MKAPIDFECPHCHVLAGRYCVIGEGAYYNFHHAERVDEAFRAAIRQMKGKKR